MAVALPPARLSVLAADRMLPSESDSRTTFWRRTTDSQVTQPGRVRTARTSTAGTRGALVAGPIRPIDTCDWWEAALSSDDARAHVAREAIAEFRRSYRPH